jgi:hypothetical protein
LDTGFSGVLTFSAMCAMILDLLSGFAIELLFPPRCNFFLGPAVPDALRTIAALSKERKEIL